MRAKAANGDFYIPVGGGIAEDATAHELPDELWQTGLNVRFRNGQLRKTEGHTSVLTAPAGAAYHLMSYPKGDSKYWIHSTLTAVYADDGTTQSNITGSALTGTADDKFTSCNLNGVIVINNGADVPQMWAGTGSLAALTGWDSAWRCKAIRAHLYFLIALNITDGALEFPHVFKWSDASQPGVFPSTWDASDPTNNAGQFEIGSGGELIDGLSMGQTFIVYAERSTHAISYLENSNVFRQDRIPGDYGVLTQNCVANWPGGHVVLTGGPDLVVHGAGTQPKSILDGRMKRWLSANINSTNYKKAFLVANHRMGEVWVCFPSTTATTCDRALIWNYEGNTFSVIELPNVTAADFGPLASTASDTWNANTDPWNSYTRAWDAVDISLADRRLVCASVDPALYLMDDRDTFAGTQIEATIEKTGIHFGDPSAVKTLTSVYPLVNAPTGTQITFQIGTAMDAERAPTWSAARTYTVGTDRKVDCLHSARFFGIRIASAANGPWSIESLGFKVAATSQF